MIILLNSIKKRTSVRGYTIEGIDLEKINYIKNIIKQKIKGPFGNSFEFQLLYKGLEGFSGKIGTYGMITGNFGCVFASIQKEEKTYIDYGYCLEKIVLDLTDVGIGTCWLGGTFNKNNIFNAVGHNDSVDNEIPAIITVGYASENIKLRHKIVGYKPKNKKRKPFDELFIVKDNCKINKEKLTDIQSAVQSAPSAMNGQPWRLIFEENAVHFYNARGSSVSTQSIDMGISMAHFDVQIKAYDYKGSWENLKKQPYNNWAYVGSFLIEDNK